MKLCGCGKPGTKRRKFGLLQQYFCGDCAPPAKRGTGPEGQLQKTILFWLRANGFFAMRVNSGGMPWTSNTGSKRFFRFNDQPGCSDIIGCTPQGRLIAIEVKVPAGKPTEAQASFLEMVRQHGGIAFVARSVEDVENQLQV